MDTKVNYITVGLFVSLLTLAVIGATIWLAGVHTTKTYLTYTTYMNEAVSGLSEKAPVKFNGVVVGYVEKVRLNADNPQQVRLILKIEEHTPISEATRSSLLSQGITGITFIGLSAEKVKAPPLKTPPNEPYPVILSRPSLLFRLDQTVENMSKDITAVAKSLNEVLSKENRESITNMLENLSGITQAIDKNAKNIDESLATLPKIMNKLESTLDDANAAAKSLRTLSQQGHQSIQDLSQQTLPTAQQILIKLKHTLANIEQLTGDLNKNPAMLIRGRTPDPLGPGEK